MEYLVDKSCDQRLLRMGCDGGKLRFRMNIFNFACPYLEVLSNNELKTANSLPS
ncbi:unnamed protein product [Schistosoma mattheei]|uniref:Uncharacterized protein n=1 Tax=Schistosoma mattheei TaxID=31246 RepID=A0A183PEP0_9TREM|nr:unnamed protein product [Schistosoma mattheei]